MDESGTFLDELADEAKPAIPPAWDNVKDKFTAAFPEVGEDFIKQHYEQARTLNIARQTAAATGSRPISWAGARSIMGASTLASLGVQRDYQLAKGRYDTGKAGPEDYRRIAEYEHMQAQDAAIAQSPGGTLKELGARLPAMIPEFALGGSFAEEAASGLAATAPRALNWMAPAAPTLASRAAHLGLMGAAVPSLYAPEAVQDNVKAGRDPFDVRGLPAAYGLGVARLAVMGAVSRGGAAVLPEEIGESFLARTVTTGALGVPAGGTAHTVSNAVRGVMGLETSAGTFEHLYHGELSQAGQSALNDFLTFFAFSVAHELGEGVPPSKSKATGQAKALQTAINDAVASGHSAEQPLAEFSEIHNHIQRILQHEPNPTRADLLAALDGFDEGPAKEYGKLIAQSFPEKPAESPASPAAPPSPSEPSGGPAPTEATPEAPAGQPEAPTRVVETPAGNVQMTEEEYQRWQERQQAASKTGRQLSPEQTQAFLDEINAQEKPPERLTQPAPEAPPEAPEGKRDWFGKELKPEVIQEKPGEPTDWHKTYADRRSKGMSEDAARQAADLQHDEGQTWAHSGTEFTGEGKNEFVAPDGKHYEIGADIREAEGDKPRTVRLGIPDAEGELAHVVLIANPDGTYHFHMLEGSRKGLARALMDYATEAGYKIVAPKGPLGFTPEGKDFWRKNAESALKPKASPVPPGTPEPAGVQNRTPETPAEEPRKRSNAEEWALKRSKGFTIKDLKKRGLAQREAVNTVARLVKEGRLIEGEDEKGESVYYPKGQAVTFEGEQPLTAQEEKLERPTARLGSEKWALDEEVQRRILEEKKARGETPQTPEDVARKLKFGPPKEAPPPQPLQPLPDTPESQAQLARIHAEIARDLQDEHALTRQELADEIETLVADARRLGWSEASIRRAIAEHLQKGTAAVAPATADQGAGASAPAHPGAETAPGGGEAAGDELGVPPGTPERAAAPTDLFGKPIYEAPKAEARALFGEQNWFETGYQDAQEGQEAKEKNPAYQYGHDAGRRDLTEGRNDPDKAYAQAHATSNVSEPPRGARTNWAAHAAAAGVPKEAVDALARDIADSDRGNVAGHNDLLREAWRALKEHGTTPQSLRHAEDADAVKGLDEVADALGDLVQPLLSRGENAEDGLFRLLKEGMRKPLARDEVYQHALDQAVAQKELEDAQRQAQRAGFPSSALAESVRGGEEAAQSQAEADEGQGAESGSADAGDFNFGFNAPDSPESAGWPGAGVAQPPQAPPDPLGQAATDFVADESGKLYDPADPFFRARAATVYQHLKGTVRYMADEWAKLVGKTAPATTRASRATGEALGNLAGVPVYVKHATPYWIETILGKGATPEQDWLAGTTFQEMRHRHARQALLDESARQSANAAQLRQQRALDGKAGYQTHPKNVWDEMVSLAAKRATESMQAARRVTTFVGQQNSPLKAEADYQQMLANPEFQAVLQRWGDPDKGFVAVMEKNYRGAMGLDETDPIDSLTQIPGLPMNAKAVNPDDVTPTTVRVGGGRGNLKNLKITKLSFANYAGLDAEQYDTRLSAIIENSLAKGSQAARKAEFYRTAAAEGVGQWAKPGQRIEGFREIPFTRPPRGTQEAEPGDVFYAKASPGLASDPYKEIRQALQVDDPFKIPVVTPLLDVFTKASLLAQTAEAASHGRNLLTMMMKPRMSPVELAGNMWKVLAKDPAAQKEMMDLAFIGAMKGEGFEAPTWFAQSKHSPLQFMGRFLTFMDQSMRLTANDAFERMAASDLVEDTVTNRRDFINQLGNYSKATQSKAVVFLRDTGVGPFATAATRFTTEGLRQLVAEPGAPAKTWGGALQLRAEGIARIGGVLAATAALNWALWRRLDGDDNTPLGAVKLGQRADGSTVYWDMSGVLTGTPRGLRTLGVMPSLEAARRGTSPIKAEDRGLTDSLHSLLHPLEGPAVQFGYTAATGSNVIGKKLAEEPGPGESQHWKNLQAALWNLNPLLSATAGKDQPGREVPALERGAKLLGPFGPKFRGGPAAEVEAFRDHFREVEKQHETWMKQSRQGLKPPGEFPREYPRLSPLHQRINVLDRELKGEQPGGRGQPPAPERAKAIREEQARLARQALGR